MTTSKNLIIFMILILSSVIFAQDSAPIPEPLTHEQVIAPTLTPPQSTYTNIDPANGKKVLAIVNSRWLFEDQVNRKIDALLKDDAQEINNPEELEKFKRGFAVNFVENWVDVNLLAAEAEKRGLRASGAEVQNKIALMEKQSGLSSSSFNQITLAAGLSPMEVQQEISDMILGEKLIESVSAPYMTEENMQKVFEARKETFYEPPKVHLLHILMIPDDPYDIDSRKETLKKMEKIRKKAAKGADFSKLAEENSQALVTSNYGGDLGWVGPQNNLPDLINQEGHTIGHVGFSLKKGEVSEVLESEYGFHIIKCIDRKSAKGTTFEEARPAIKNYMLDELGTRILENLKAKNDHFVVINMSGVPEKYLMSHPPAAASPTPKPR